MKSGPEPAPEFRSEVPLRLMYGLRDSGVQRWQLEALTLTLRDVALGAVAVADLLAVEEHGRVVLLALADDDDALHRHRRDQGAHGLDSCPVRAVLVAAAHPATAGHGRGFGDPHQLEGKVAVRNVRRHHKDELEKLEHDHTISEDDLKRAEKELQKLTDRFVAEIDEALDHKEKELMEV